MLFSRISGFACAFVEIHVLYIPEFEMGPVDLIIYDWTQLCFKTCNANVKSAKFK
jgi:hypothetical protein